MDMPFNLICRYRTHGGIGEFAGQIDVTEEDGYFEGKVLVSPFHKDSVRGFLRQEDGKDKLRFVKFPEGFPLANTAYFLQKDVNDGSLEGDYTGLWVPHGAEFNRNYEAFAAQIDGLRTNTGCLVELALFTKSFPREPRLRLLVD